MDPSAAAANNAALCDLVCRSAGLPTVGRPRLWSTPRRSPDGYPDAVTLSPGVSADEVLDTIDSSTGASVKDSFGDLDLSAHGFTVLFDAQWIARRAARAAAATRLPWRRVDASHVSGWIAAHGSTPIGPDAVDDPCVRLFLAADDGGPLAVGALNRSVAPRSPSGPDAHDRNVGEADAVVVGVSNVAVLRADPDVVWSDLVALARAEFGSSPLVGYEIGPDLDAPVAVGFETVGPLRVWMRTST